MSKGVSDYVAVKKIKVGETEEEERGIAWEVVLWKMKRRQMGSGTKPNSSECECVFVRERGEDVFDFFLPFCPPLCMCMRVYAKGEYW